MLRHTISISLAALALLSGCERDGTSTRASQVPAHDVEEVVARVGGRPIGASDVAARMQQVGMGPEAALELLVDESLLVAEARRRGLVESADEERALERLMVRAMLHDFESELTPESISTKEVRADFEEHRDKFDVPERRASWHILVKDSSEAGRKRAQSILAEVRRAEDPKTVYRRYEAGDEEVDIEVKAEELPAISMKDGLEKPYKDALFSAKTAGLINSPVKTTYGWHVLVLTEILPEETRTLEELEAEIRERLSQKKRFEKLVATVQALHAEGLVQYDDQGVDRLLSSPGLPTLLE